MAKSDTMDRRRKTIDIAHDQSNEKPTAGITQRAQNTTYRMCMAFRRTAMQLITNKKQVRSGETHNIHAGESANTVHLTYDSGADGHYMIKDDRKEAGMPILRSSNKKVGMANGDTRKATNDTQLPFPQLSKQATIADTFNNFPTLLKSVGKNLRQWNHLHFHQEWRYSTQRNRRTHQMQRSSTPHWSKGQAWVIPHPTHSKKRTMATKNKI